jgi:hypothetical protein
MSVPGFRTIGAGAGTSLHQLDRVAEAQAEAEYSGD